MKRLYIQIAIIILLIVFPHISQAQKYAVESFRSLPNDVTAFIDPVKDLNDEDCALIKVLASGDFAFSTPLGIVKRVNKTGEIWLYIPKGSKKITLKHPEWGVLRDYKFPMKIDSHITYELRVKEPYLPPVVNTVDTIVTTVRDTLVLTRVDTLVVKPAKKKIPFSIGTIATIGFGGNSKTVTGGLLITAMKRHGGFIHMLSDFGNIGKTIGECDKTGKIENNIPFYSGKKRHGNFIINAGAIHRLSDKFRLFEGIGYGYNTIAWQLADSEGGGYVKNNFYSYKGVSFEVGTVFTIKRFMISASAVTISGKQWFASLGFGINIGK